MKNILKITYLRNIFIISLIIAIALPATVFLHTYPSFNAQLTKNTEDEAIRVARHLMIMIIPDENELTKDSLSAELMDEVQEIIKHFKLMKLKIFSKSGEIIHSTSPQDIGVINKKRYFYDIVVKGNVYTKVVEKDTKSLEDQIVTADVVETYVPIMKNNVFVGAFEIYYDITARKESLENILSTSLVALLFFAISFMALVISVLISAGKNIIRREQIMEVLGESEERTRATFNAVSDAVFLHPLLEEGFAPFVDVNDTACERYGYTREEFLALKAPDITKKADADIHSVRDHRQKLRESGRLIFEATHIAKSGEEIPVEINSAIIDLSGCPMILAVVRDITHRKRVEEALLESEEKYRHVFESANVGKSATLLNGEISVNKAFCDMLGYCQEELRNKTWQELTPADEVESVQKMLTPLMEGNKDSERFEKRYIHKDGSYIWTDVSVAIRRDKDGKPQHFINTIVDITDRKRVEKEREKLQAQLNQSQKMESIGTLAGGIAHDFNNILSPVIGYTELLLEDIPEGSPLRISLNEVLKGALRAKDLVKQILTFSRQTTQEIRPLNIQNILKEVLELSRSTLPSTIEIKQNIHKECGMIMADPTQVHQITMNLITNAYHAMEDSGGTLTVGLKDIDHTHDDLSEPNITSGPYVCLTIADTGEGMDDETQKRLFEPYFTTKERDKGTGLGLAVVHGIVSTYNGAIVVESEQGKGTEFKVYIPRIVFEVETKREIQPTAVQTGNERVLLVDDEEPISVMVKTMLERLGYQVSVRNSSTDTLEAFRAAPDRFDLVITDMTMPNLTGDKLAIEIKKIRPDIPIILCTGFSEKVSEGKPSALGIDGVLMKPIGMGDLAKALRDVLDRTNRSIQQ